MPIFTTPKYFSHFKLRFTFAKSMLLYGNIKKANYAMYNLMISRRQQLVEFENLNSPEMFVLKWDRVEYKRDTRAQNRSFVAS